MAATRLLSSTVHLDNASIFPSHRECLISHSQCACSNIGHEMWKRVEYYLVCLGNFLHKGSLCITDIDYWGLKLTSNLQQTEKRRHEGWISTQLTTATKMLKPAPSPPHPPQTPVLSTNPLTTQCLLVSIQQLRRKNIKKRRLTPLQWKQAEEHIFLSDFLVLLQYFETLTKDAIIKWLYLEHHV